MLFDLALRDAKRSPGTESPLAIGAAAGNLQAARRDAHVAEWQTRTAQDRMGKPVEVRLLS
jgi:hypothetical protein